MPPTKHTSTSLFSRKNSDWNTHSTFAPQSSETKQNYSKRQLFFKMASTMSSLSPSEVSKKIKKKIIIINNLTKLLSDCRNVAQIFFSLIKTILFSDNVLATENRIVKSVEWFWNHKKKRIVASGQISQMQISSWWFFFYVRSLLIINHVLCYYLFFFCIIICYWAIHCQWRKCCLIEYEQKKNTHIRMLLYVYFG